jgi:hypothetical protein
LTPKEIRRYGEAAGEAPLLPAGRPAGDTLPRPSPGRVQMEDERSFPHLRQVVLDTTDARGLAEFYRQLLGFTYRPGDEPPEPGATDERGQDWLVLHQPPGTPRLAFQHVEALRPPTWPDNEVPQQLHLDVTVRSVQELNRQHHRALQLGARLLHDRSDDQDEPLRVYADPAGHPFCLFVATT